MPIPSLPCTGSCVVPIMGVTSAWPPWQGVASASKPHFDDGTDGTGTDEALAPWLHPQESANLVQISQDRSLARSREPLLRKAGFQVFTVGDPAATDGSFSVPLQFAVLCQTISLERALACVHVLQELAPGLITMRITRYPMMEEGNFHLLLEAPVRPQLLVHKAETLRRHIVDCPALVAPR